MILLSLRDFTHGPQQRRDAESVNEDGKRNDRKGNGDEFFAPGEFWGKTKHQSQRQCSTQSAPEQRMLVPRADS